VLEVALRLALSLALVVGLMLLIARWVGRRYQSTGSVLDVVHRQQLSRGSSVVVVTTGGRGLVLGVTDQQVNLLAEVDAEDLVLPEPDIATVEVQDPGPATVTATTPVATGRLDGSVLSPQAWRQLVDGLRKRA
jgi:flagellar protein FliO/FliZ